MMSLKKIIFPENQSLDLNYVIHILSCFLLIMVYQACCLLSINPHPTKWGPMKPQVIINIYHRSHGWTTCSRFKQFVLMYQSTLFHVQSKPHFLHEKQTKTYSQFPPQKYISLSLKRCQSRRAFVHGMNITFTVKPMCKISSLINQSTKNLTFFDLDNSYLMKLKKKSFQLDQKTINV